MRQFGITALIFVAAVLLLVLAFQGLTLLPEATRKVLQDFQTLFGGMVALVAAILAAWNVRLQLQAAQQAESERRERDRIAAAAALYGEIVSLRHQVSDHIGALNGIKEQYARTEGYDADRALFEAQHAPDRHAAFKLDEYHTPLEKYLGTVGYLGPDISRKLALLFFEIDTFRRGPPNEIFPQLNYEELIEELLRTLHGRAQDVASLLGDLEEIIPKFRSSGQHTASGEHALLDRDMRDGRTLPARSG